MVARTEIWAAWAGVLDEDRRSEVPDVIGFADVRVAHLQGMSVPPVPTCHVLVPRRSSQGSSRPLHVLGPMERATYRALVARVAPQIERRLSGVVVADRVDIAAAFRGAGLRLVPWRRARARYASMVRRLVSGRSAALLIADVRDCFARIRPRVVAEVLAAMGCRREDIRDVESFLSSLEPSGVHGLPVGPEPSAVLANAVLSVADRFITESGGRYVRWVDDYLVAADGGGHARELLDGLRLSLAEVGLGMAEAKCRVLGADEARTMPVAEPSGFLGTGRSPSTVRSIPDDVLGRIEAGPETVNARQEVADLKWMGERRWGRAEADSLLRLAADGRRSRPVRAWGWHALARTDPRSCLLAGEDAIEQDPFGGRPVVAALASVPGRTARSFLRKVLGRRDELEVTAVWALAVGPRRARGVMGANGLA